MKIKAYDKYQKVNVEISPVDDEVTVYSWASAGSWGNVQLHFHSPDMEDYDLKRWSDLENITIGED